MQHDYELQMYIWNGLSPTNLGMVRRACNSSTQKTEEGTIVVSSSLSRPTQEDPASKQRNTLWYNEYTALPEQLEVTHHRLPRPFPGELLECTT